MIVTNRPPRRRRPAKPAQAAKIAGPRVVQTTTKGRARKPLAPDPEADARVAAFFARLGLKLPVET
jgi:hypothetical protein